MLVIPAPTLPQAPPPPPGAHTHTHTHTYYMSHKGVRKFKGMRLNLVNSQIFNFFL